MADNPEDPFYAWTIYWRTGLGASCSGGGSERVLAEVWRFFAAQFKSGDRLIDLATGNGVAARLCAAAAQSRGVSLRIEAIDAADIDSEAGANHQAIAFHSGVRLEQLPYPDAIFDGVLSQFGIEYADETAAVAEAARVLAPGGRMRLVIHAREGAVCRDVESRLARLRAVLAEDGAVGLVRALARAASAGRSVALAEDQDQDRLRAAAARASEIGVGAPEDDAATFYANGFLTAWQRHERYDPAQLAQSLEEGWARANAIAVRHAQMLSVARTETGMFALEVQFASHGLEVDTPSKILDGPAQIAWQLDAMKPPGN